MIGDIAEAEIDEIFESDRRSRDAEHERDEKRRSTQRIDTLPLLRPFEQSEPRDDRDRGPNQAARPRSSLLAGEQPLVTLAIGRACQPDENSAADERQPAQWLEKEPGKTRTRDDAGHGPAD